MATRRRPQPATTDADDPPATTDRDDSVERALARSREIRETGNRQMQAAREHAAREIQRDAAGPDPG